MKGNDLQKTYQDLPVIIRGLLFPGRWLYQAIKRLDFDLRVDAWLLSGRELNSGEEFRLLFSGTEWDKNYFAGLVFGKEHKEEHLGRPLRRHVATMISQWSGKVDAAVDLVNVSILDPRDIGGQLLLPAWVSGVMDFSLINEQSGLVGDDIRKLKRENFTYEVLSDPAINKEYFFKGYLPYVSGQFGNEGIARRYEEMVSDYERIELLLVNKGNECAAGKYLCYRDGKVFMDTNFVMPGKENLRKAGALRAGYYFTMNYLREKGIEETDFGGSRPFFGDGVLWFKKRWGLRLGGMVGAWVMRLRLMKDTAGVRGFLVKNPFISVEGQDLFGNVFISGTEPLTPARLAELGRYRWPGIKRAVVHCFEAIPERDDGLQANGDEGLEFRKADGLFRTTWIPGLRR